MSLIFLFTCEFSINMSSFQLSLSFVLASILSPICCTVSETLECVASDTDT